MTTLKSYMKYTHKFNI